MRLGIDFGTTRTVVAAAEQGRYPVAAFETDAGYSEYLPGIAVLKAGKLRFGFEASQSLDGAECVVRSIKRSASRVALSEPVEELAGRDLPSLLLVTRYLAFVRRMIVEKSNLDLYPDEPLEAMVAVPANASTRQRYLTLEAFKRAGFQVLGMINEPTAGAIEFARRNLGVIMRRSPKRYLVVYDLGGGTFDTAAVSLDGRRFELITSEGIARLGGDDFDEILLGLALESLSIGGGDLDPGDWVRLLTVCQEAKEGLTPTSRKLLVDLTRVLPETEPVVLDVAEYYDRCQPLLDQTIEKLDRVFTSLVEKGIDPDNPRELGAVYLVGGGSAFPQVARTLRTRFKRKVQLAVQPHAATAIGLAVAADAQAEIYVRESSTRHFGVWREAQGGREQVFDPIMSKDLTPDGSGPLVVRRYYRPVHAIGHLRFLECSGLTPEGQPTGDLTPWAEIYFPYEAALLDADDLALLHPEQRLNHSGDEIAEVYTYANDGTIRVDIQNRTRGYNRSFALGELR
jgi:molecular chaperone DnaK (HSP70)